MSYGTGSPASSAASPAPAATQMSGDEETIIRSPPTDPTSPVLATTDPSRQAPASIHSTYVISSTTSKTVGQASAGSTGHTCLHAIDVLSAPSRTRSRASTPISSPAPNTTPTIPTPRLLPPSSSPPGFHSHADMMMPAARPPAGIRLPSRWDTNLCKNIPLEFEDDGLVVKLRQGE